MSDPRSILFVHHSNDLYGADRVLLETVRGLDRTRYIPFVVLPDDCKGQGRLASELDRIGVCYQFVPLAVMRRKHLMGKYLPKYALEVVLAVTALRRIIKERQIVLVHSNTLSVYTGALAAKSAAVPHIWHVHEMLVSPRILRKLLHIAVQHLSSAIICVSGAVRQHLLEDQPKAKSKAVVVYNGLPLERFDSARANGEAFRRENGIPLDAPLVGMIGRVNRWKGQTVLAQAAQRVLLEFPESYFVSVGGVFADEHRYLESLRDIVARLNIADKFRIADFRMDVPEVLAAIDIYVHPSVLPEPFGLVVLEAMAARKVVICAAHGGPLEMIEDGKSGYLVRPGDVDALANRIILCLRNRAGASSTGECARERALQMFEVSRYLSEIQAVYDKVVRLKPLGAPRLS